MREWGGNHKLLDAPFSAYFQFNIQLDKSPQQEFSCRCANLEFALNIASFHGEA